MIPLPLLSSAVLVFLFSQRASAFWILAHNTLTTDRLDPIVTPGKVSGHVHTVIGASNFGPTVEIGNLVASECTTAPVQDDKSSYWAPQMYHKADNGSLTLIPIQYVNTYYKQNAGSKNKTIAAFPKGLRMIAGNPYRTTYDENDPTNKAIGFVCLDFSGSSSASTTFPTQNCKDGLRAQVTFPSCWNGKDLDSTDHTSHIVYPESSDGNPDQGDCPENTIRVVTLFIEWIFDVGKIDIKKGNLVFSFGDDVGYGFHSDFISGWDEDVLNQAVQQCTGNLFSNVEGCPPFTKSINKDVAKNCKIPSVVDEDIGMGHPISQLPGCNPIPVNKNPSCSNATTPAIKSGGVQSSGGMGSAASGAASTGDANTGGTSTNPTTSTTATTTT